MIGSPESPGRTLYLRPGTSPVLGCLAWAAAAIVAAAMMHDRFPDSAWVLGGSSLLMTLVAFSPWNRRVVTLRPTSMTIHRPVPKTPRRRSVRVVDAFFRFAAPYRVGFRRVPRDHPHQDVPIPYVRIRRVGERRGVLVVLLEGRPGAAIPLRGLSRADRLWLVETLKKRVGSASDGDDSAAGQQPTGPASGTGARGRI